MTTGNPGDKPPQQDQNLIEQEVNFVEKHNKIRQIIASLYKTVSDEKLSELMDAIVGHSDYLQSKYPDYNDYAVWHIMAGSTPNPSRKIKNEDFPKDDSVLSFVENLASKY